MIFQKNSFIVTFSFWRQLYMFYQPSLDKYNSCLCRTITGKFFWTLKIARTCFCCPISLITMWKRRFWGGGEHIYICDMYILSRVYSDRYTFKSFNQSQKFAKTAFFSQQPHRYEIEPLQFSRWKPPFKPSGESSLAGEAKVVKGIPRQQL